MFPILLFAGLASFIAWAARPKITGIVSPPPPKLLSGVTAATVGKFQDSSTPAGFLGPPIQPEEERLLTLLVLWAKDKKFPVGQKRFMTAGLAKEAAKIALRLGLRGTARAVLSDGPIPADENLGRRGISVRKAVVEFASGRRPE
jgi:hypothetical protein